MQVEGVEYEVAWEHFRKGSSFFVPCIDTVAATEAVTTEAVAKFFTNILTRAVIEDGIRGLRVWHL